MTTTINAVAGTGLVSTSDGSGVCKVQSNGVTTNALAWVRFNGVTTVTIASSYNISSVTRSGTGNYTVSFTNAAADANYSVIATAGDGTTNTIGYARSNSPIVPTTASFGLVSVNNAGSAFQDAAYFSAVVFGN